MQSSRRQPNLSFRVIGVSVAVVLVAALSVTFIPAVRSTAHAMALPLWRASSVGGDTLAGVSAFFRTRASLERENNQLEERIRNLQLETFELVILQEENRRLQSLWERRLYEESVLGRVLARPTATPYGTAVLDVGHDHGVSTGDIVLVESVAVGSISDVFLHTSLVRFFSAPGVRTVVSIATSSLSVEAEGIGGGNFVAKVPRDIEISEGDVVLMPDVSARIFAVVEKIQADASDPFQTVRFQLPVNIGEIDWMEIIVEGTHPLPENEEL